MKKLLISILFFCTLSSVWAQKSPRPPFPKSIIDVGIGVGPNFGIFGGQAVIGYKGTGLLIAGGTFNGVAVYQVGVQASYKWFFASLCYGVYGTAEHTNKDVTFPLEGFTVIGGGKINLVRSKKLYLELGAGWSGGDGFYTAFGYYPVSGPTAVLGLGYRISFKKAEQSKTEGNQDK